MSKKTLVTEPPIEKSHVPASSGDTFVVQVRGTSFRDRQATIKRLCPEERLRLVRHKTNQFDPNAILIICPRLKKEVGYIPAEKAALLAPFIDGGGKTRAWLHMVKPGGKDWVGDEVPSGLLILVELLPE